ncbi:MAG: acyl-CoA synthetase [Alphaproteobacteria bacterium]
MTGHPYDTDLDKNPANYQALSPLSFLEWSASTYPDTIAVVHGPLKRTYREFYARSRKLASALAKHGIKKGDTVAVFAPNIPAMLEAHYGVPMIGAVINAINTRLDGPAVGFILDHGEAKVLIVDRELSAVAKEALEHATVKPLVIDINDPEYDGDGDLIGEIEYEDFIAPGDENFEWSLPDNEWDAIALNYTSGTTGNPKGVVYHHRGAYLLSQGNAMVGQMPRHPVYLWTLPMFHCNGWCFTWTISVLAGTHVCLRRVEAGEIYKAIADHDVTHMCGAPIVMGFLVNATDDEFRQPARKIEFLTAAAPPPPPIIAALEERNFAVTHLYGLTETYGPSTVNAWHEEWDELPDEERSRMKARQGVRYPALEALSVRDPETMELVPQDGETIGEVMFQGNVVMKGYLKNPKATNEAFEGGWFHSGDLGVWYEDGYIQLKDRSKDIIISGGENISSIEVEATLYKHPAVLEAAVVAKPDEKWGETPCAFIGLKEGHADTTAEDIIQFCRDNLAHFKCPRHVIFTELPKTSTGKIQKFKLRDLM